MSPNPTERLPKTPPLQRFCDALNETETKLLSTEDASEYGVPTTSTPAKYSWLGSEQQPTELPSGVIAMGARSYVPELGRFLQPDPIPGGSANAYTYTFGDPVNSSDPSGALTYGISGWLKAQNNQEAKEVAEREVARETLEREEAERRAQEAAEAAAAAAAAAIPAEAEEPLGGYAGWACEYAAETGQEDSECGGGSGGGCSGDNACAAISAGGWACAIDGTLVAVGVGLAAPSAGASVAVSVAASAALGLATTVACEYSPVHNIELSGLPRPSSDCFYVLTISKRTHIRGHRTEECYA